MQCCNEILTHFSQFISEKVKKKLRKSRAQFREKLRKLKLRQNYGFLMKKNVYLTITAIYHDLVIYTNTAGLEELRAIWVRFLGLCPNLTSEQI